MRIVATANVPPVACEAFAPLGEIEVNDDGRLAHAEVLIVRGTPVGARSIESAVDLRVIARTGAGYDNLDVELDLLGFLEDYVPRWKKSQ